MSRTPNSARAKSGKNRTEPGFEKEYKEIRDLNSGTSRLLAEKQSELDAWMRLLAKKKLVDIHGNQTEMTSMKADVVRARKIVMATGKYLTVDLKPSLTKLADTAGKYAVLMQKKLNDEFDEYGSKKVNVEAFVSMVKEMQEMQDFAQQLNSSIAEMDAEIYLAAVQILSAEKDINAINDVIQGRVRKEKEAQRQREEEQRRLEEEKKRKKEEEKRLKEEAAKKRKEEEEQRKREEEERKRQKEEEEERKRIEEEERRLAEEELERQRQEEEEKRRIEEEDRRRQEEELERQRKEEEDRQRKLQEEAQRKEEKRRKLEVEERKKEEEEKRRQDEEERKRRADPSNWTNVFVYDVEGDRDAVGHRIACVIRAPDDVTLDMHNLTCTVLDTSVNRYPLGVNEELVGNIVNIRPSDQSTDVQFPNVLWMAFPFNSASKTRETVIKLQDLRSTSAHDEATVKAEWIEVPTRDAVMQNGKVREHARFVETELLHLSPDGINVVVVAKPKTDRQTITSKGGQLRSSIDQRILVTVPKNAFRTPTPMSIQAIPIDSAVLKERYDGCDYLLGTSPVVLVRCQAGPQKPLTLTVPNPSGSGRRSRPKTSTNDRRPSMGQYLRPSTSMTSRDADSGENDDKDFISLVTREASGRWRYRDEISLDVQKETTSFEMSSLAERLLLLRTKELLQGSELVKIAQNLDQSLEDRLASVLVRQNPSDLKNLYVECCKRDVASKRIQSLFEDQLTQGPTPNQVLFKEGDLVEVSFSGNIHFEDRTPRLLTYHSNLTSPRFLSGIKEVDGFAQNALDNYRGTMRLRLIERPYKPPNKFLALTDPNRHRTSIASTDTGFICEFPITLPKPAKEVNRAKKIHLPLPSQGPLTDEYLDHLSEELSEEWKMLANRLKFSSASVQRIYTDHAHRISADATQRSARQMLSEWFRSSSKATDKAEKLQWALASVGRTDLAEELDSMNRTYKEESERKQNDAHLMKCIKAYSDSQAAVNMWRSVGLALGLVEGDLEAITSSHADGIREQARTMLRKWIEVQGDKATKDSLIRCLKKLNLNEAAGKVKLVV